MLLTDSDLISADDLQAKDPECRKVAGAESPPVVLEGDGSIIRQTMEECGHEISTRFQQYSGYLVSPGMSGGGIAAVMNIGSVAISRPRFRLNQVVGLHPDPSRNLIKRWIEYRALMNLYRGAFARFSDKNDRFQRKMKLYAEEQQKAWDQLAANGIPIVLIPLPCPGALREPGAGSFNSDNLSAGGAGSADPGSSWYVAITWTGAAYQSPLNPAQNESGPSELAAVETNAAQKITVSIAGLVPPGTTPPNVGISDGIYSQVKATGYNCYAGNDPTALYLQNVGGPIPAGTLTYTLADMPVLSGARVGTGQFPDYNYSWSNVRFRA